MYCYFKICNKTVKYLHNNIDLKSFLINFFVEFTTYILKFIMQTFHLIFAKKIDSGWYRTLLNVKIKNTEKC